MTPLISVQPVCLSRSPPSCSCLHPGIPEPGLTGNPGLTGTDARRATEGQAPTSGDEQHAEYPSQRTSQSRLTRVKQNEKREGTGGTGGETQTQSTPGLTAGPGSRADGISRNGSHAAYGSPGPRDSRGTAHRGQEARPRRRSREGGKRTRARDERERGRARQRARGRTESQAASREEGEMRRGRPSPARAPGGGSAGRPGAVEEEAWGTPGGLERDATPTGTIPIRKRGPQELTRYRLSSRIKTRIRPEVD